MLSLFLINIFHTHLNMSLLIIIKCYAQDKNLCWLCRILAKVSVTGMFVKYSQVLQENCTTLDDLFVITPQTKF